MHNVFTTLDKTGRGIILFHDIHANTAKAIPAVLAELKARGLQGGAHGAEVAHRDGGHGRARCTGAAPPRASPPPRKAVIRSGAEQAQERLDLGAVVIFVGAHD